MKEFHYLGVETKVGNSMKLEIGHRLEAEVMVLGALRGIWEKEEAVCGSEKYGCLREL